MLRFLHIICDGLAALFAILSPVAIVHWLATAINNPGLRPFVDALTPVFQPLNEMVLLLIQPPSLMYQGQPISTTQGILACLLTAGFFVFHALSEFLKASEQKLQVRQELSQQNRRWASMQKTEKKKQKESLLNRRIVLYATYPFEACPTGKRLFEKNLQTANTKLLNQGETQLALEFETLKAAFTFALETAQGILSYYATLRPMDPQPPFQMAINATGDNAPVSTILSEGKRLVGFAGNNQVLFNEAVKTMLEAQGAMMDYQFQSLGLYAMSDGRQEELFRLYFR